ncbi:hypothetical protein A2348_03715 [Candidatus Uhrbacteria bacterium RIFOXYB12_FULL_58_10]|uniref:YdbS-like PH domain-containing protein n=1 Tax=Candidatus Uhrbacteria bacterium RIFOXYB2_FULL_57_15 TaxID=1802422 RepID=A0A1F7W9F7_9BACT|nr:MAG: hypothetical protein A2348_03715 [Candidatus Uhrbacteria bacterium RIFOXYB12_FULL_58_10]OGL99409.1 MAG: hypothetical protein A2304_01285 [Candidatus Uhrbacteria bacterium RIFOXYB2_FULL_57_15]OGL99851.1 MAG: hypothetical protein A2501_05495 [Candidatus Uhrbacteria bacterium RIFOXYC12_FULL_57_11]
MAFHIDKTVQLKPEEEVLEVVREDIVPHLPRFALLFFWFVAPFFFLFPLFRQGWIGVVIFFALVGSAATMAFRSYLRWSNTMLILTDRRVIDVERRAFFDRVISETSYAHVDDVTYRVKGIIPTLFRYGDLRVHVAGSAADIEFRRVARPSRVHDLLNDLRETSPTQSPDRREHTLKALAKGMTMEQIERMATEMRTREREEAIEEFMSDEPHA